MRAKLNSITLLDKCRNAALIRQFTIFFYFRLYCLLLIKTIYYDYFTYLLHQSCNNYEVDTSYNDGYKKRVISYTCSKDTFVSFLYGYSLLAFIAFTRINHKFCALFDLRPYMLFHILPTHLFEYPFRLKILTQHNILIPSFTFK